MLTFGTVHLAPSFLPLPIDPAAKTWNKKAICYGATYAGGSVGYGLIYSTDTNGMNLKPLFSFSVVDGLMPSQAPVLANDGMTLLGTTSQGGDAGSGAIYSYNTKTGQEKLLASFTGPGGSTPQGGPIIIGNTAYGVAGQGGAYGYGVVYSVPVAGGTVNVMHHFASGTNDTGTCFNQLVYNPNDKLLYGVGFAGAANGMGGVFSIKLDGSGYKLRSSFTPETGAAVQMGGFIVAKNGLMYANGWVGGSNKQGTLMSFNPKTNVVKSIFSYSTETGTQPYNSPIISASGKWFYVLTWLGGKNNVGTILAVSIDGKKYKVLKELDLNSTGGRTFASPKLNLAGDRILAAMSQGGSSQTGTLISYYIPIEYR